ncbi:MAG: hypothetical protein ACLQA5_17865 [Solirubrobacteraceae bacterium]
MTEDIETSSTQPARAAPGAADSIPLQARIEALVDERPEVAVGAAFAGGLLAAMILKRLGR